MNKITQIFLVITCITGLLTSCYTKDDENKLELVLDDEGNYTGFSNLPTDDTVEDYKEKGYFVKQDSEVINQEVWDQFIETATGENETAIRMVRLFTEEGTTKGPYYQDLFYKDKHYYFFDSSSEYLKEEPFKYLLTLEGQFGNSKKDSGVIILTDDNTLTYEDVMNSFLSSVMLDTSPFQLIMFQ
ncbi:hypothetical protein HZI73_10085 [Vallitalea pronyensis]|uniref:Lipoprotein n=1 Tax=Vallitalea pronyensis TaxID=1348613 RepID=A0A8J8MJM5_9FIRM|nr:hypothetical protein [Vallitalea pronyensis]QUI22627.1 hypothetical protein HZI73_10085 [Vallitalea pronyensis]